MIRFHVQSIVMLEISPNWLSLGCANNSLLQMQFDAITYVLHVGLMHTCTVNDENFF